MKSLPRALWLRVDKVDRRSMAATSLQVGVDDPAAWSSAEATERTGELKGHVLHALQDPRVESAASGVRKKQDDERAVARALEPITAEAQAWASVTINAPVRLAIAGSQSVEVMVALTGTTPSKAQSPRQHPLCYLTFSGSPVPSAVVIEQSPHRTPKFHWQWPFRLGVLPSAGADRTVAALDSCTMVRRGLATVVRLGFDGETADMAISSSSIDDLADQLQRYRGSIRSGVVAAQRPEKQTEWGELRDNLAAIRDTLGASGIVAADVPVEAMTHWVDTMLKELSHNLPLDVAVWRADTHPQRLRDHTRTGTIFLADASLISSTPMRRAIAGYEDRLRLLDPHRELSIGTRAAGHLGLSLDPIVGGAKTSAPIAAKALNERSRGWVFDEESKEATSVAELAKVLTDAERHEAEQADPQSRFADFLFLDDGGTRVPDTQTGLRRGKEYTLEVAVRRNRIGIRYAGEPEQVALPPSQGDLKIYVVIAAEPTDFEVIGDSVQAIELPPHDDSTSNARFRLKPIRESSDPDDLPLLNVRLYYELNLVEHVHLVAEVLPPRVEALTRLPKGPPIQLIQRSAVRDYRALQERITPRALHIHVTALGGFLEFRFTIWKDTDASTDDRILLSGRTRLQTGDLNEPLRRIRTGLLQGVLNDFSGPEPAKRRHYERAMRDFASQGQALWALLFRQGQRGAMWNIGEILSTHPPKVGSPIQVTLAPEATRLVFPWSFLYAIPLPSGARQAVNSDAFWGLRYVIEQRLESEACVQPNDQATDIGGRPLRWAVMLNEKFPLAKDQAEEIQKFQGEESKRLTGGLPPIGDVDSFLHEMRSSKHDVLYFFTHGSAATEDTEIRTQISTMLEKYSKELGADYSNKWLNLQSTLEEEAALRIDSWIQLSRGRIFLGPLRGADIELTAQPFVFLNMCESAQVYPSTTDSFVLFFLDRGARSVIGTECPMSPSFAHPFAVRLLAKLFGGSSVGVALCETRRELTEEHNSPLGLAYTLYGSAQTRFEPPVLTQSDPKVE